MVQIPELRKWRKARALTQEELAERAGVSSRSVAGYEGGAGARPSTVRKLAKALGVEVTDLFGGWEEAFDNSLRFRAAAKERLQERLELWKTARDEEASDEMRRTLLDQVGLVLDEAGEVLSKLLANLNDGLNHMAEPSPEGTPNAYWTEVQKADTLYREMRVMVEGAGLSVRSKTPSDTARARQHELEALTA